MIRQRYLFDMELLHVFECSDWYETSLSLIKRETLWLDIVKMIREKSTYILSNYQSASISHFLTDISSHSIFHSLPSAHTFTSVIGSFHVRTIFDLIPY
jgi:hypothetical protein